MESNGWKGNFHNLPGYDEPVALGMESMLLRVCIQRYLCLVCWDFFINSHPCYLR